MGAFTRILRIVNLQSIFEEITFQRIRFGKYYLQHLSVLFNIITLVSTQLKFQSSSPLVVDFMLVALIFPTAIKYHIGTCCYVASQMLKSIKYKLSILKALLSECHYSHHRCWLSRSLFSSHLIPAWIKLNSKARMCRFPSLQFMWE